MLVKGAHPTLQIKLVSIHQPVELNELTSLQVEGDRGMGAWNNRGQVVGEARVGRGIPKVAGTQEIKKNYTIEIVQRDRNH